MSRPVSRRLAWLFASTVTALAAGCSGGRRQGGVAASVAPSSSASPSAIGAASSGASASVTTAAVAAAPPVEVVPLILLHGHGGDPRNFGPLVEKIGPGRVVLADVYAKDAEALAPGSLPRALVVQAGFYREERTGVKYDLDANGRGQDSIGGCPAPRTDGAQAWYPISYAERIRRIVDGVRRATGAERVDLALHSMGTVAGRAYTRWLSVDPVTGKSAVRRVLAIAGPNRGVNAFEATVDGLEHGGDRSFMRLGELAEMCGEYRAWSGRSFLEHLNDDWDGFCTRSGIEYAGVTATGAHGKQVSPGPPKPPVKILGIPLSGPFGHVATAILALDPQSLGETWPLVRTWAPHVVREVREALEEGDGTVRVASARMDAAPFLGAKVHVYFEGRHGDVWNPEQGVHVSRLASQLVRTFLDEGKVAALPAVDRAEVKVVDAPGHASWIAVDVKLSQGTLLSAQLVEETLDQKGKPTGGATGYGAALAEGEQRFLVPVARGGGTRRYHLVLYGPRGKAVHTSDTTLALTDGPLVEKAPEAKLDAQPQAPTATGPEVVVTATSDAPAQEPTLRYSWRVDRGAWSPFGQDATIRTKPLAPGIHEVEVRARHARNAAAIAVDTEAPARLALVVDAVGAVKVLR